MTPWLVRTPRAAGLNLICIEAPHAHAVISAAQVNKNDHNDVKALAQLVRTGWYRATSVYLAVLSHAGKYNFLICDPVGASVRMQPGK